jgi:hypothetical protein
VVTWPQLDLSAWPPLSTKCRSPLCRRLKWLRMTSGRTPSALPALAGGLENLNLKQRVYCANWIILDSRSSLHYLAAGSGPHLQVFIVPSPRAASWRAHRLALCQNKPVVLLARQELNIREDKSLEILGARNSTPPGSHRLPGGRCSRDRELLQLHNANELSSYGKERQKLFGFSPVVLQFVSLKSNSSVQDLQTGGFLDCREAVVVSP